MYQGSRDLGTAKIFLGLRLRERHEDGGMRRFVSLVSTPSGFFFPLRLRAGRTSGNQLPRRYKADHTRCSTAG